MLSKLYISPISICIGNVNIVLIIVGPTRPVLPWLPKVYRAGDTVTMYCFSDGNPLPATNWRDERGNNVSRGGLHVLQNISAGHDYSFECVATSRLGNGSRWMTVNTKTGGRPSKTRHVVRIIYVIKQQNKANLIFSSQRLWNFVYA